jgi:hypothetical protein
MKRTVCCAIAICLLSLFSANAFGYLGKSIRIMSIGNYLAGVVRDQDTDIYRNPAYLSFVDKVRVFGQYNLYGHTELSIARGFSDEGTGLLGLALPTTSYGNLALVCELKPNNSRNKSVRTYEEESIDEVMTSFSSSEQHLNRTIEGFKAVYGVKLSPSVRVGTDFTYLKNNHLTESQSTSIRTLRYVGFEDILYKDETYSSTNSDDSPDAQRASVGIILDPRSGTYLDLTLYYENSSYTKTVSSTGESYKEDYRVNDSPLAVRLYHSASSGPAKNRAVGLDANLRRRFPHETSLVLLLGLRYGESGLKRIETLPMKNSAVTTRAGGGLHPQSMTTKLFPSPWEWAWRRIFLPQSKWRQRAEDTGFVIK